MGEILIKAIQVIIALGLLNVWLVRANRATAYRGGNSKTLREEFAVYGLSNSLCSFVGFLKISSAILLLVGLWFPALILPAAVPISILMLFAVLMYLKVKDPVKKVIPTTLLLVLSIIVLSSNLNLS